MDDLDLLIDLHIGNDRQGPGSDAATRRAIDLAGLTGDRRLDVADVGCGTGASTLTLGRCLDARITAIDACERFVRVLGDRAVDAGFKGEVNACVGDMGALPFEDECLDVIWSEAAVYNIGFEAGVRGWGRHLRRGGLLVVSDLTWTTVSRPAAVDEHWVREYPGITTASEHLGTLERCGFSPVGMFFVERAAWEEGYYVPLERSFEGFLRRHGGSAAARRVVDAEEAEIRMFREFGAWYGYAFYVARRVEEMSLR